MRLKKKGIREEWETYYAALEGLRRLNITSMIRLAPYLAEHFKLPIEEARIITANWCDNWEKLAKKYNWIPVTC